MLLLRLDPPSAALVRVLGLAAVVWSLLSARHAPGLGGRELVVTVTVVIAGVGWLAWTVAALRERELMADVYVMAVAGGVLCGASPDSAASVFVFVAVVMAAFRVGLRRAVPVAVAGTLALAISESIYDGAAVRLLAYALGFAGAMLAASNARQSLQRADQAELLLAQTQRSQEERLRAARLEESTRIAREIHDVLAHALAGLTIQLEATAALIENGAGRDTVLARVRRAHELARDGLRETRRAVGVLRADEPSVPAAIEALVAGYRSDNDAPARLRIDDDAGRLAGDTGQAAVRVVQEALTNVGKHAPGAEVSVDVHVGDGLVVIVSDHGGAAAGSLAATGGGYGLRGMRERAESLGGSLTAGPADGGWRVELRLPAAGVPVVAATEGVR